MQEGILLHRSASRLSKSAEVLLFPNLETVIFITFFEDKFMVSECFSHTENGTLKPFFFDGENLIFGDPKNKKENSANIGILLYASGLDDLAPYLKYLVKIKQDAEIILIPAQGGRLEGVRKIIEGEK